MDLLAAIDLRAGMAVRLVQGDFDRQRDYGDPLDLADRFAAGGARWLHLVDLDAARTGSPVNRQTIEAIVARVAGANVSVQVGGGIRTREQARRALDAGARRVVMGTAALDRPDLVLRLAEEDPGAVAIGLDFRRRGDGVLEPAVRGWTEGSGTSLHQVLGSMSDAPFGAVVVTSIERDGMLSGPDLDGLADALDMTALPVVASGGVASTADLRALAALRSPRHGRRLAGAVVGRALLDGRMKIDEAVAACEPSA
ncbi:MAG: 1-(5-phosphoribosyl)-5-[(5-phosphoribosylamino)methylideneamino]imidazole-4-carboxamide isomerase [Acidimicrobiales bacterium]